MKKFLTVLLALSVVFTYTVGTAFAALPSDTTTEAGLAAAKAEAISELNSYKNLSEYTAADQNKMKVIINDATKAINDAESVNDYKLYQAYKNYAGLSKEDGSTKLPEGTVVYYATDASTDAKIEAGDKYTGDGSKTIKDFNGSATEANTYIAGVFATDADGAAGTEHKGVNSLLTAAKGLLDNFNKADVETLADAKKAAKAQFNDYVYLIDQLIAKGTIDKDMMKDANVGSDDYDAFKAKSIAAIDGATDVNGIEEALKTSIEKADKIYALIEEVEVPQATIDALVKAIRSKASAYRVTTSTHSSAIVASYETAIEEGVTAAKAIKTWKDYYTVSDKYLGLDNATATAEAGYGVYARVSQVSEFEKLANKNLQVETAIKAVKKVLEEVGEYDWKAYDEWSDIETFYHEAKYFVDNGAFDDNSKLTGDAGTALKTLVSSVKASDTTNQLNGKVATAADAVKAVTTLGKYKADAIGKINAYKGTTLKSAAVSDIDTEYDTLEASQVKALQLRGANAIGLAETTAAVDAEYAKYTAQIDAINTKVETGFAAKVKEFNKNLDDYVAEEKNADLTTDQQKLLDRFVKDLKAEFLEAEDNTADTTVTGDETLTNAEATAVKLSEVVAGYAYTAANVAKVGYDKTKLANAADYNTENAGILGVYQNNFKPTDYGTWAEFFAGYDNLIEKIDKLQTKVQEDYVAAIKDADKAIEKLGTPVLTNAYKADITAAKDAYEAYLTAKAAFDALSAKEQAEVTAKLAGEAKYLAAKQEYDRLVYVDSLDTAAADPVHEVRDFAAIAKAYLGLAGGYYTSAGRLELAKIIDETYTAIDAAATADAKASAALAGIAKLEAVAIDNSGNNDLADLLARAKADATKYFTKYENATFISDAVTTLGLIKDILAFNEQFSSTTAKEKAAKIKATESLKVIASSKLYKGKKIQVKWRTKGDASKIDGYQVYKSTKAQSGYKFMGKTKKLSMDNKKGLKKGTRYYYKIRAYVEIDGQKYYSDWSNKANRIYKK